MQERLQKLLSGFGVASRREAEKLIEAGVVKVNVSVILIALYQRDVGIVAFFKLVDYLKLMLNAINLDGIDSKAFQRRKENATEGITDSNTETGLKGTELELTKLRVGLQHDNFIRFLKC